MAGVPQTLQIPPPVSIQTMLYNTYLQIIGGGNAPFVGPLDALIGPGVTVARAYSQRRLLASYTGPADILRSNGVGLPETTINYLPNGDYDLSSAAGAAAAGGGTQAFRKTWRDQSGNSFDATTITAVNQPPFTTSIQSKGAIGGIASTDCYLNFDASSINPTFCVYCIISEAVAGTRAMIGPQVNTSNNYIRYNSAKTVSASWPAIYSSSVGAGAGAKSITVIANVAGTGSQIRVNNAIVGTGTSPPNSMPSAMRIGSSGGISSSWFTDAGNTISEMIIFNGNPTSLAGWNAFDSVARSYYA